MSTEGYLIKSEQMLCVSGREIMRISPVTPLTSPCEESHLFLLNLYYFKAVKAIQGIFTE